MQNALRRVVWTIGIVCLAWLILVGVAGRTIHTAVAKREVPIYAVETGEKVVALGINCAWDDKDIAPMLQTLAEKNAIATFFLVGNWCRQYPESAMQIAEAGHELGSHSNTHPDMTKLSREEVTQQLQDSRSVIEHTTGQSIRLFRSPSGAYNDTVVSTARALGWEVIQWDADTLDWKGGTAPELVANGMKNLQNGSILLLHAGAKHSAEALPLLIDEIYARGYRIVPVGEMIYPSPYTIDHTGRQKKS